MRPSADEITVMIQREQMKATGAYDTLNSNISRMDDPSAHVLEYRLYWLSTSVVFTLKYILGLSIFVSGGSKERKNGALKFEDVSISSCFVNIESYHSYTIGILTTSPI